MGLVYNENASQIKGFSSASTATPKEPEKTDPITLNSQTQEPLKQNPPFISDENPGNFSFEYEDPNVGKLAAQIPNFKATGDINNPNLSLDSNVNLQLNPNNTYNPLENLKTAKPNATAASKEEVRGVTKEGVAVATKSPSGGTPINGNPANVSVDIADLAKQAGLSKNDLLAMSTYLTGPANKNLLAAWVYMLYNGSACVGSTVSAKNNDNVTDQPISIEGNMLMYMWTKGNSIIKGTFHKGIMKAFKKTPAYKDKFFEDVGDVGITLVSNSERLPTSPMTGAPKHVPSLLEKALNSIHPKFCSELEKYVNVLRGKTYLALPSNILGSIQYAINYISGIFQTIAGAIMDIYNGMLTAISEFIVFIDSIMGIVMGFLLSLLDKIIPLEILCLILDIISVFAGDLTEITNLMTSSLKISDVLKQFNVDAGIIGDFLSDPKGSIKSFLPEEFKNIINIVDSVANDPMGYLGSVLGDYGNGYMMNYLKGDIMGGILNQFGSKAPVLYPLAGIMKKYGINGQIDLGLDQPSRNAVLPPALIAMRRGIKKTFTSLGDNITGLKDAINADLYTITGPRTNSFGFGNTNTGG